MGYRQSIVCESLSLTVLSASSDRLRFGGGGTHDEEERPPGRRRRGVLTPAGAAREDDQQRPTLRRLYRWRTREQHARRDLVEPTG